MNNRSILCVIAAVISGCAVVPSPANSDYAPTFSDNSALIAKKAELVNLKTSIVERKKRLDSEKLQAEIDKLKREIEALQSQIDDLEDRISKAEAVAATKSPVSGYSAQTGSKIGPRGGCYTITKSGKKNYGGC